MRKFSRILTLGLMALGMVAFATTKSEAAFVLYVCNDATCSGGGDYIVADNTTNNTLGMTGDNAVATGRISAGGTFAASGGNVNFTVVGSFSLDPVAPQMDLNWLADGSGVATQTTVWVYAFDTGFTSVSNFSAQLSTTLNNTTITGTVMGGDDNTNPNFTPVLLTLGPTSSSGLLSGSGSISGPAPYSLGLGVRIVTNPGGDSSGDFRVSAVPEPTSLVLLGSGLLAVARRRKLFS